MTERPLVRAVARRTLLCDGAMGTQLQQAGLEPGGCGEAWNLDQPDRVLTIQRAYVEAGSDCLITNTFGASRIMLERHGEARVEQINRAGVEIARAAFGEHRGWVLGDIGPFGGLMEPYGDMPADRVAQSFAEQVSALVTAGADAIIIETQTAFEELELAIDAARAAGAPCIIASMAFDLMRDGNEVRTMMGISPEQAAEFMTDHEVDVAALNCGTGVDMIKAAETIERYREVFAGPLMAQPNAGQPVLEQMRVVYRQPPGEMADGLPGLLAAGAGIVGGCCGSTPEHIAGLRRVLDLHLAGVS